MDDVTPHANGPGPRTLASLPAPRGLPLLGNALQIVPAQMHLQLENWAAELGPIYRINLAGRQAAVFAQSDALATVLRDRPQGFRRYDQVEAVFNELGVNGVFSAEGERWKRQRRIWLATLNANQIRGFHDRLGMITGRLLRRWQRAAEQAEVLDITAELMRYTVDVTTLFALGHDGNTLEQGDDVIQKHLNKVFPAVGRRLIAWFPTWRYFKRAMDREIESALAELKSVSSEMIADARRRLDQQPDQAPSCFLEALVAARDEDGSSLSESDVFANCLTALLGGEDTTANTQAWLIHYLAGAPDIAAALHAEADALMGDSEIPDASSLPALLPWTDACINETMRLKPIAPYYLMTSLRATDLCGVALPAGTHLMLLPRFAAGSAPVQAPAGFAPQPGSGPDSAAGRAPTFPFGFGPRLCPGRNLALAELRSLTLMLARNFDVEAVAMSEPVKEHLSFTLSPENLRVRLHRRHSTA